MGVVADIARHEPEASVGLSPVGAEASWIPSRTRSVRRCRLERQHRLRRHPVTGSARGAVRTRLYRDGKLIKENFPPDQISDELRQRHGCVIWLDLCEPNSEQLDIIGTEFGLHKLAIEDALEETQRTKIDRYRTHLFMSAYSADTR